MKDKEIRTAEKIIDSSFDPSDTMAFFYATYQDGEYILTQLDQAVDQEKMIRNAVGNLEEHNEKMLINEKLRRLQSRSLGTCLKVI